jgi:DNA-binding MarR family transcriptional regulator
MRTRRGRREAHRGHGSWSLLTGRGLALVYITRHPGCTRKELAEGLRVTDRTATKLLGELIAANAIRSSNGDGRRLHYEVNLDTSIELADGRPASLEGMLRRIAA